MSKLGVLGSTGVALAVGLTFSAISPASATVVDSPQSVAPVAVAASASSVAQLTGLVESVDHVQQTVTMTGTAAPNERFILYSDADSKAVDVRAGDDGTWRGTIGDLRAGDNLIMGISLDRPWMSMNFDSPVRVTLEGGATDPKPVLPPFVGQIDGVSNEQHSVTVSGTGAPHEAILFTGQFAPESTVADADGKWSITIGGLPVGDGFLYANGNSNRHLNDTVAPLTFNIAGAPDDTAPKFAIAWPEANGVTAPKPTWQGTGTPLSEVRVVDTETRRLLAIATVNVSGKWTASGIIALDSGRHTADVIHRTRTGITTTLSSTFVVATSNPVNTK